MNKTNELLQKLNTMQNEHIKDIALINKGYKIKSNE